MCRSTIIVSLSLFAAVSAAYAETADPHQIEFFEQHIRPVLVEHCYECHSSIATEVRGGLRVDSRDSIRRGGETGPAIVPGEESASLLLAAMRYEGLEMPPSKRLPEDVVKDFESWIKMGAPDPRDEPSTASMAPPESPAARFDFEAARQMWPYRKPTVQSLPSVDHTEWPRRRWDYFVLDGLERAGTAPTDCATRRNWIRRCSFDLVGLPPTPDDVQAYLSDNSPEADTLFVDKLLASPRFGERWARMWLDVARYAEDQAHIVGDDKELFFPNAHRYRDWVIQAFQNDMPYDRFVTMQLAADVVVPDQLDEHVALGFLGLGPKYYNRRRLEVMAEEWEDRVDVVSRGLLGLTVACARCHDHKFDPISTSDYYALAGVFASTEMFNRPVSPDGEKADDGQAKNPEDAIHIVRETETTNLNVFIRGDVKRKGDVVPRRFLTVLCSSVPVEFSQGSGRRELAEAIVSPENPLTARVFVNRVFAQLMGTPIVATPSNFGAQGQLPTQPELLDDLATRFVQNDWSMKWLIREIVLSATYRQSSCAAPEQIALDPNNKLLGRTNRRRLGVEAWRDAILSVAGRLDDRQGGKSVDLQEPGCNRRTVYSFVSRFQLDPMLARFDFPDANVHSENRVETTTPLQKLFVMNSPFVVDHARRLSNRIQALGSDDVSRIQQAYQLLFARPPSQNELELGLQYLRESPDSSENALWRYAHALLASNELMFVD